MVDISGKGITATKSQVHVVSADKVIGLFGTAIAGVIVGYYD